MNGKSEPSVSYSPPMKNFICSLCGLEFTEESYMTTHIQVCKDGENPTDPLGSNTCTFEYVDCTQVCQNRVDFVEILHSQDLLDKQNIKCETPELKFDIKSEEIEFTEAAISGTYTGQPIVNLKTEPPEQPFKYDDKAVQSSQREERIKELNKKRQLRRFQKIPVKCTICDYASTDSYSLARHMRTHTGEKPFKCTVCNYAFAERCKLTRHMRTHSKEKPFKCTICDFASAQNSYLTEHMRKHTGEKPFKCTICNYACRRGYILRHHVIQAHAIETPFKCIVCDYAVTERSKLLHHMQTHSAEKPFKCTLCDYAGESGSHLREHMKTHTGEKPFQCTLCDYSCAYSSQLIQHKMQDHTYKPFDCTVCDYASVYRCALTVHMRKHTGEKPFKCTICDYASRNNSALKKHMQTVTHRRNTIRASHFMNQQPKTTQ